MKLIFEGCLFLFCFVTSSLAQNGSQGIDFIVTVIIASVAGGLVFVVLIILLVRCLCLKCKKTPVRNIRPRGLPSYEESRRVYRIPAPPAYTPRNYPSHPPPSYESHLPLPGVTE